jgi:hypothetical protein
MDEHEWVGGQKPLEPMPASAVQRIIRIDPLWWHSPRMAQLRRPSIQMKFFV